MTATAISNWRPAIDMAVELDTYREFLAILSREIEKLRQQIDG